MGRARFDIQKPKTSLKRDDPITKNFSHLKLTEYKTIFVKKVNSKWPHNVQAKYFKCTYRQKSPQTKPILVKWKWYNFYSLIFKYKSLINYLNKLRYKLRNYELKLNWKTETIKICYWESKVFHYFHSLGVVSNW